MSTTTGNVAVDDTTAVRPLRKDAERSRRKITEAARELLAERGLAFTLNDVAHHANVGVGTVYRHFPDREELIDAALADQLDGMIELVEAGLAMPDAWEGLLHVVRTGLAAHMSNRALRDVALAGEKGKHQTEAVEQMLPLWQRLIDRAHEQGTLRADVDLADLTMVHFMLTEFADHSADVRPDAYARYLALFVESWRVRPDAEDLGPPLSEPEVTGIVTSWIETHRTRSRGRTS